MSIPDSEGLFRFVDPVLDFHWEEQRVKRSIFSQSSPVSVNREAVWDRGQHETLLATIAALRNYGLFRVSAGALRAVPQGGARLDIEPKPIVGPDVDPLLRIPIPAHAQLSRLLTAGEQKRSRILAQQGLIRPPVQVPD